MVLGKTTDPSFTKFLKTFPANEIIFNEGDEGKTLILILSGSVSLVHGKGPLAYVIDTVNAGSVLGERAFLKGKFTHSLTAQAATECTVLEFTTRDLKVVEKKFPNLTTRLVSTLCNRLDKLNEIVKVLQSETPASLLVRYLLTREKDAMRAKGDSITTDEIFQNTHIDKGILKKGLDFLETEKVLLKKEDGTYSLRTTSPLSGILPALQTFLEKSL